MLITECVRATSARSKQSIAGITNEAGNVLGMMPHPERCAEEILGNTDGLAMFAGLVEASVEMMAPTSEARR